jgi:hypothetical protein
MMCAQLMRLFRGLALDSIAIKKAAKKAALNEKFVSKGYLDKRTNT